MPTLSLPDGSSLTWDAPAAAPSQPEEPFVEPFVEPSAVAPSQETPEEVRAALARMPPKWRATAVRFGKSLIATVTATLVVFGGNIEEVIRDPKAFVIAFGSAAILAVQKWASWKDEA
jgi:hypothetical protein